LLSGFGSCDSVTPAARNRRPRASPSHFLVSKWPIKSKLLPGNLNRTCAHVPRLPTCVHVGSSVPYYPLRLSSLITSPSLSLMILYCFHNSSTSPIEPGMVMNRYIEEQGGQDDDGVDGHGLVRRGSSGRSRRRRRWDRDSNKRQKSFYIDLV
jgi:hypothetical protein